MAERGAHAEPGIGQDGAEAQPRRPQPVNLGQGDLRLATLLALALRHAPLRCPSTRFARGTFGSSARAQRSGSSTQAAGRNSRRPTGTGTSPPARVAETRT